MRGEPLNDEDDEDEGKRSVITLCFLSFLEDYSNRHCNSVQNSPSQFINRITHRERYARLPHDPIKINRNLSRAFLSYLGAFWGVFIFRFDYSIIFEPEEN